MFIRRDADACAPVFDGLTFGRWIDEGHAFGWPSVDDLEEHLTTLFPPVRPRGFFEVRTLDALPDEQWPAAASIAAAVVLDADAAVAVASRADGLQPGELVDIVRPALDRLGVDAALIDATIGNSACV